MDEECWEDRVISPVGVQWEGVTAVLEVLIEWEWPGDKEGTASSLSAGLYFLCSTLSDWSCQAFD